MSTADNERIRLDKAVQQQAGVSRAVARRMIICGQVKVNGLPCKVMAKELRSKDRLEISALPAGQVVEEPSGDSPSADGVILYQDKYIIVINKPAGIICEESHDSRGRSVVELLRDIMPVHPSDKFYLVHRLDATTTGVLIVARRPAAADNLFAQFREHSVRKSYLSLVKGELGGELELNGPIGRLAPGGQKHGVRPDGKEAFTRLTPLSVNQGVSLVWDRPTTGRTHQIRVHSSTAGYPLLGDKLYGGPRLATNMTGETRALNRALLHAYSIDFTHPKDGTPLHFEAPLADDMAQLIPFLGLELPTQFVH